MTLKELDEIESQLDKSTPFYVPSLLAEIRQLQVRWEALKGDLESQYHQGYAPLIRTILAAMERMERGSKKETR